MKEIKLTKDKIALVDDEDYDFLMQWKWCATCLRGNFYAVRWSMKKKIAMHRIIMKTPTGLHVDHINHITLDNRKHNLRNCTLAQNNKNRITGGLIPYLGVNKFQKYYYSRIHTSLGRLFLGSFRLATEAAFAYDIAAMKYHGEFANLNFKYSDWFKKFCYER